MTDNVSADSNDHPFNTEMDSDLSNEANVSNENVSTSDICIK